MRKFENFHRMNARKEQEEEGANPGKSDLAATLP